MTNSPTQRLRSRWTRDDGQVTAFVVVFATGILALAGLTLDGGLALAAKVKAAGQAESAARAGAQAIDLSIYRESGQLRLVPADAVAAARSHLTAAGATGTVTVTDNTITVLVADSQPTQLLALVGISTLHVDGTGRAHAQLGIAGDR